MYASTSASSAAASIRRAPSRTDLIQRRTQLAAALVIGHYSQHRRSFLAGAANAGELVLVQRGRYAAPRTRSPIHNFRSYLRSTTSGDTSAPITALGLSSSDANALEQALDIKSVGDLADNKYVRRAQAIVALANERSQ